MITLSTVVISFGSSGFELRKITIGNTELGDRN
jgi:hypothetical protein